MDNISDVALDCTENVPVVAEDCSKAADDKTGDTHSLKKVYLRNFRMSHEIKRYI